MLKNLGGWAILLIILAAVVAIVLIACRAMGVPIPGWVVNVGWVLVIAFVCVGAIRLLTGSGVPPVA